MFERYITNALTNNFGHILENVDSDKMRLSAWDGELTLEDVAIKSSALDTILKGSENAPVEIAYGHIGHFKLKIPWSLLSGLLNGSSTVDESNPTADTTGAAISVVLTDVDILITPRRKVMAVHSNDGSNENETGTEGAENQNQKESTVDARRAEKERKVQSLLDANLLKRVTESSIQSKEDAKRSWATWIRQKLTQLLSNLSITVTNIHIRYEDPGTSMGFEWKIFHEEEENYADLINGYSNLSLNLNAASYGPLRRKVPSDTAVGGNFSSYDTRYLRPRRFRPAFAIGITLKEFSVQSVRGSNNKEISSDSDEQKDTENQSTLDDATTSVLSATTATSNTNGGKSIVDANDSTMRRQHKRAAANDLAIYWDSTTTLMSGRAMTKFGTMKDNQEQPEKKKETFDFYQACFSLLNEGSPSRHSTNRVRASHSYLLDPISPSVDLMLVSKLLAKKSIEKNGTPSADHIDDELSESADQSQAKTAKASESDYSVPPSSIKIELPPCSFTLSKNTLEDTVYLRKSLSVWTDARKAMVSESALRRIIKLRPSESALKDPTGWWKYAFEATKLLTKASLSQEADESFQGETINEVADQEELTKHDKTKEESVVRRKKIPLKRRRGWVGLVEAVIRRRGYVKLYRIILEPPDINDRETQRSRQQEAHDSLLKMEDQLLAREIVAFRIHAYDYMKQQSAQSNVNHSESCHDGLDANPSKDTANEHGNQPKGRWTSWLGTGVKTSNDKPTPSVGLTTENEILKAERTQKHMMMKGETDDEMLSIEHRRWMMNEMKEALDRERSNKQNWEKKDSRRDSPKRKGKRVLFAGDMPIDDSNPVIWTASLVCRKLAIQINDQLAPLGYARSDGNAVPVIRMSSAWVHDHYWFHDGSWDVDLSFASMEVIDLISGRGKRANSRYVSTLLGSNSRPDKDNKEYLVINGIRYHRNVTVKIKKRLHWNMPAEWIHHESDIDRGSTTTVAIQVLPMEVIYSDLPIETVKRIFLTVKTPELVDDYHKVLGVAQSWRNKQKERLLETLAHKNKQIVVDIDIAAPELLIPEDIYRPDSPMIAINFGRFRAYNEDRSDHESIQDFDDQWRVVASNIQVQSTSMASYHSHSSSRLLNEQLVEAFSIDFVLSTKIIKADDQTDSKESRINVSATLPRLAFNITSSAIRLISRLRQNSARRKREIHGEVALDTAYNSRVKYPEIAETSKNVQPGTKNKNSKQTSDGSDRVTRMFEFEFSAPAITLKLENDVDGRDSTNDNGCSTTPILDLALRSIRGNFSQKLTRSGDSVTKFEAKLKSLGVIDLYQTAGKDFALLMSSVPQSHVIEDLRTSTGYSWDSLHARHDAGGEVNDSGEDLVTVEYVSSSSPNANVLVDEAAPDAQDDNPDRISLWFHELYVEWNPETIAAIHAAMRTTTIEEYGSRTSDDSTISQASYSEGEDSSSDDEFFDAMEEEMSEPSDRERGRLLSEITTSADNLVALGNQWSGSSPYHAFHSPVITSPLSPSIGGGFIGQGQFALSPGTRSTFGVGQYQNARVFDSGTFEDLQVPKIEQPDLTSNKTKLRRRDIIFKLSKLRVSFNRETRSRKLVVAQMDRTFVSYSKRATGGSRIKMSLGNLVFVDPAHEENKTLYGQILGLQSKSTGVNENSFSSLLEMDIIMNPKVRSFWSLSDDDRSSTVAIDREHGTMTGSNTCITARLSPMRFVLIEQLWMEFMDYFFQGIIGTEVLGGQQAKSSGAGLLPAIGLNPTDSDFVLGSDAEGISFTRFDISLESPEILFPVSYRSPDYLRMKLSKIRLSNKYNGVIVSDSAYEMDGTISDRMQWFNNCMISLDGLRLYSWTERELGCDPVDACVSLRWPTGQFAPRIIPKWRVNCTFDTLDVSLCRSDYALLQNILSYNIGEPSRHMDEWKVLQTLSQDELKGLMEKYIVHFGYDQKDVAPTTYDVRLSVPSFKARFLESDNEISTPIAIARCFDFQWQMRKESDLIVRQKVTCGIDLVRPTKETSTFETLMTISKENSDFDGEDKGKDHAQPDFVYTSTSFPNGDNVKLINMIDPCIYLIVPAWSRFTAFFSSLGRPVFLNEKEIGTSIQVGDRWYRIGDGGHSRLDSHLPIGMGNVGRESFSWISTESTNSISNEPSKKAPVPKSLPTRQIKVLLTWPRIILSSVTTDDHPTRVILRMNHLDFLQTTEERKFEKTRSVFLHDVEVYTSSKKLATRSTNSEEENNSLIRPWSLSAVSNTCIGEGAGDCTEHTYKISGDVLRARAAYSDMSIAVDVVLSVLHTAKERTSYVAHDDLPKRAILSNRSFDSGGFSTPDPVDEQDTESKCSKPSSTIYDIELDGFELKVADDSGRHFSGFQELAILSIGKTFFSRHESANGISSMKLWLDCLDLFDCLQPIRSPFRNTASSHSKVMGIQTSHEVDSDDAYERKDSNIHRGSVRKMPWTDFATKHDGMRYFESSQAFQERMVEASTQCSHYLWGEGGEGPTPGLIEIACKFTGKSHQEYDIRFREFAVQWNPSSVIAIQRFLGRLRKESKLIAVQVFQKRFDDLVDESSSGQSPRKNTASGSTSVIRANIEIDSLTVCMNKEHQNRRLLELTLSSCSATMHSSEQGITMEGGIGDLAAFDRDKYVMDGLGQESIIKKNRNFLTVLNDSGAASSGKFLQVQYRTFTKKATFESKADVPQWVKSNLPSPDDIDDFLSLTIAATRFTYLKERTDELLDYLSNGLPGKGMGATSRAAKGFISRRIQTRSFLQLRVSPSQIYIPQHEMAEQGIGLKLGDVNLQSWFEEAVSAKKDITDSEWWRVLSLKVTGFSYGLVRMRSSFDTLSSATNPIDLDIMLRKPTIKGRTLSVRGIMSCFDVVLNYEDYALLRAVVKDNIGRYINTEKWDNVEKAYELENQDAEQKSGLQPRIEADGEVSSKVAYSDNARFVRYGKGGKKGIKKADTGITEEKDNDPSESNSAQTLDVRFDLAGVALKLRRNDLPEGIVEEDDIAAAFYYDVMLLRVGVVEVLTTANASGDVSFSLSLFRVGLFDLGDSGRLIRQRYYHSLPSDDAASRERKKKALPQPCPFVVLAEGYLSPGGNDTLEHEESDLDGPDFVISVDSCPASSTNGFSPDSETALPPETKVTVAKVVINYLSLNAITRPFREIADFFSCAWPVRSDISSRYHRVSKSVENTTGKKKPTETRTGKNSLRGIQLKVVAHYPRVFFLADESDLNSRALVLKGLAVANLSTVNKREAFGGSDSGLVDIQRITSVGAQLHGLETYINPDVSAALRFRHRHSEMVGGFSPNFNPIVEDEVDVKGDALGVALIQPVTIGIECMQVERDLFPTRRSLQINIDPVSTMLSFQDLQLVETVLKRWSSDRRNNSDNAKENLHATPPTNAVNGPAEERKVQFQVVFSSARLGLGLRTEGDNVVVNTIQGALHNKQIDEGDILVSVGDKSIRDLPLEQVVKTLARSERPVTVGFERIDTVTASEESQGINRANEKPPRATKPGDSSNSDHPISCYTLHFRSGMQLGLAFEKSVCGQFPVVTKLLSSIEEAVVLSSSVDEFDTEQIEVIDSVFNSENRRMPRIGAVVVAVDDVPVEEVGVEEVWKVLTQIQGSDISLGSFSSDIASNVTFSLTFQETNSSTWGKVDTVQVSSAGIALSFIDDLNGRDMPLFRAKLKSTEMYIERGLGINAHILDNTIPSLLTPLYPNSDEEDSEVCLSIDQVKDIQTESILSFSVISICSIDYFRPRVSFWEPLLEPSQLFLHFEKQDGSVEADRPAQVALEVSDRILHDQFTRATITQSNHIGGAHMVSINITDAAAAVFNETSTRWKDWRQSILQEAEEVDLEYDDDYALNEKPEPIGNSLSDIHMAGENSHFHGEALKANQRQSSKRAAAKKAAQGALIFAQRRGAETSKKSDSATPFIFRNRTGISIAFVQQGRGLRSQPSARGTWRGGGDNSGLVATIGEYDGLEEYDQDAITELADLEDAKFNMNLIDEQRESTKQPTNKIRTYEGRYPDLMVAIQAVAGIIVEPMTNLQVLKVGSTIRHLTVKRDNGSHAEMDPTCYSIQVVWNVEIEDNRRILTLSTAVRVVSAGLGMPVEIGFKSDRNNDNVDRSSESEINSIGIARSDRPFYMPLWLALRLEPVSIYVRPARAGTSEKSWSESSVLHYGRVIEEQTIVGGIRNPSTVGRWAWEESFSGLRCICCHAGIDEKYPIWFSVFGSSTTKSQTMVDSHPGGRQASESLRERNEFEACEVLSITLDSGLTVRNMLPAMIETEVFQGDKPFESVDDEPVTRFSFDEVEPDLTKFKMLTVGECTEVFEVNYKATAPKLRIKHQHMKGWSTWAHLELDKASHRANDINELQPDETTVIEAVSPRQVNVQISGGDLGIPMTLGVRIEPKMTNDDTNRGCVYGVEVIVYAELWIRNITSLPLNFGCPSYQIYEPEQSLTQTSLSGSIAKFTAESALMELTSLLDGGAKGTAFNQNTAQDSSERSATMESLPGQKCRELTEEVFEYVEIENSTVKRKWWASESYNGYHKQIFDVDDSGSNWKWLDENWAVDSSGGAKVSTGGWESCKNLSANDGSFGGNREFHPSDGFRRRRFFRRRSGYFDADNRPSQMGLQSPKSSFSPSGNLGGGIQAFHQPLADGFSREQKMIKQRNEISNSSQKGALDKQLKIAIRCGDGVWSSPAEISDTGTCYGVIRALASRWPRLTTRHGNSSQYKPDSGVERNSQSSQNRTQDYNFKPGCLAPDLYEFCYTVCDVDGEWGEFSRSMEVSPRFIIRNDSTSVHMKVKQSGAPDSTCVIIQPGEAIPFYWADFRLPKLVSTLPCDVSNTGGNKYKWSGGFDLCNLGMTPVRIRSESVNYNTESSQSAVTSIRVLVEVRPGTGGHGINVSLREEAPDGDGALFRIENLSPFPIWLSQDGVLANPTATTRNTSKHASLVDGDYLPPNSKSVFSLDVPYRQGKYAHRKEASLSELMHVRAALAPLSSRVGIESVKVIGLATMGESIRLNLMKLPSSWTSKDHNVLQNVRVMGVVATDGPTRVLRFCLMAHPMDDLSLSNTIPDIETYISTALSFQEKSITTSSQKDYSTEIITAINETLRLAMKGEIPTEVEAKRQALFAEMNADTNDVDHLDGGASDKVFSFRVEFSGFLFSLVDSAPSEIALVSLRNVNALARWNRLRSTDATLLLSIGWLQVDNHIPSAPFKVAVRPDLPRQQEEEGGQDSSPLLVVAVAFAPEHKSKIVVLRSVTIAPRDLVIALDLAFLVRVLRFFSGLKDHLRRNNQDVSQGLQSSTTDGFSMEEKKIIPFPNFTNPEERLDQIAAFSENKKMYFQGLTILPTNIKLSVAPAKALTLEQANLEGKETAAIHTAVRKGDLLAGGGPLGVRVGRKNKTLLAVVRGVFKSIVVDALLRLSEASLNFHGVFLRNHIATSTQLSTYLAAHYLSSLKYNVPALLGSLSAIGNPLGLIRGIGDGVTDFVMEPMKGFRRALNELDPGYAVDGVARGTESLARHTVGGIADSASLLMETFSKYMAVVTLDRRYAQKRDRNKSLRLKSDTNVTLVGGVESGFVKLVLGFREGVTGVVKAPIRGAEKRGLEGFAKGLGKGLLGLLVKPIIGITDAATDVMIGVKSTVEYKEAQRQNLALVRNQFRPRRPMYGREKVLRPYSMEDAAAATLMLKTRCAGENYMSHLEMNDRVALLSTKRLIILGPQGEEQLALKFKHVSRLEVRSIRENDGVTEGWAIVVILNTPRRNGSDLEVISCSSEQEAIDLCMLIQRGVDLISLDYLQ